MTQKVRDSRELPSVNIHLSYLFEFVSLERVANLPPTHANIYTGKLLWAFVSLDFFNETIKILIVDMGLGSAASAARRIPPFRCSLTPLSRIDSLANQGRSF